jgi:thiaminase
MTTSIVDEIVAIRERWHTKRHPFFQLLADGKLPLRALGVYMALHGKFVQQALASFGIVYARTIAHEDFSGEWSAAASPGNTRDRRPWRRENGRCDVPRID